MDDSKEVETYWSERAATFDDEPDHGLADPQVRSAWADHLRKWLPAGNPRVADLGCGTGSLSVLLAERGAEVVGVDLSPAMVERAVRKAHEAGADVRFAVGDVSRPDLAAGSFDVVLCRHVLWNLPDPVLALNRWDRLLRPGGRLVVIEGRWGDAAGGCGQAGISAGTIVETLSPLFHEVVHYPLSDDPVLWGRPVTDERYAVVAQRRRTSA